MNELTDIEICKRIAEIEQPKNLEFDSKGYPMIKVQSVAEYVDYDPLTDKALCFDLMVKYKVDLMFFGSSVITQCYHENEQDEIEISSDSFNDDITHQKLVCLAIIAKHK